MPGTTLPSIPPAMPLRYTPGLRADRARRAAIVAAAAAGAQAGAQSFDKSGIKPAVPGGMGAPPQPPGALPAPSGGTPPLTAGAGLPDLHITPPAPIGGPPMGGTPDAGPPMGAPDLSGPPSTQPLMPITNGGPPPGLTLPPPGSPAAGGPGALPLAQGGMVPRYAMGGGPLAPPDQGPPPDMGMGVNGPALPPSDHFGISGKLFPGLLSGGQIAAMVKQYMDANGKGPGQMHNGASSSGMGGQGMGAGLPTEELNPQDDTGEPPSQQQGESETPAAPPAFEDWLANKADSDPSPLAQDFARLYDQAPDAIDDLWAMALALAKVNDPDMPDALKAITGMGDVPAPPEVPLPMLGKGNNGPTVTPSAGNGLPPPLPNSPPGADGTDVAPLARGGKVGAKRGKRRGR